MPTVPIFFARPASRRVPVLHDARKAVSSEKIERFKEQLFFPSYIHYSGQDLLFAVVENEPDIRSNSLKGPPGPLMLGRGQS